MNQLKMAYEQGMQNEENAQSGEQEAANEYENEGIINPELIEKLHEFCASDDRE
jgi:hypothetical protein